MSHKLPSLPHSLAQGPHRENFHPVREGLQAARINLRPGLFLQVFALVVVVGYYSVPAFNHACAMLADFRAHSGFMFSIVSTAIFGGLIPFLYLRFNPNTRDQTPWSFLPFYLLFWGWSGFVIDSLYQLQALLFGARADVATVIKKVAVDQLIFNPLYAVPAQVLAYHWKDRRYSPGAFKGYDWADFFLQKIPTTLISTWGVWIPMVSIVYSLPSDLQIPLFNLILCFWVLLLTTLTRPRPVRPEPVEV